MYAPDSVTLPDSKTADAPVKIVVKVAKEPDPEACGEAVGDEAMA